MSRVLTITLNPAIDLSFRLSRLEAGTVHRAEHAESLPGGKGHNVARVLAAEGHTVTAAGFLGATNAGVFADAFRVAGITDGCTRIAGRTRTNVKIGEADGRVTDINMAGPHVDDAGWAQLLADVDCHLAAGPAAAVVAGSLPQGISPRAFGRLIERIALHDVPVWLDTSGAALAAGVSAGPALAKPNQAELAEWATVDRLADPDDEVALARVGQIMRGAGAGEAVISRGGEGTLWLRADGGLVARPPRVPVVNTVSAGDTLLAGLLHGRLSGWPDERTLVFASALAAESVTHDGVGRSDAADFAALCDGVTVAAITDQAADDEIPGSRT